MHTRGEEGDKEEDTEKDKRPERQTCKLFLSHLKGSHQIKERSISRLKSVSKKKIYRYELAKLLKRLAKCWEDCSASTK